MAGRLGRTACRSSLSARRTRYRAANSNGCSARYLVPDRGHWVPAPENLAALPAANRPGRAGVPGSEVVVPVRRILKKDTTRQYDNCEELLDERGQ